jgi:ubiquinone/menaquinone biosynthesis C-methylase UbiE
MNYERLYEYRFKDVDDESRQRVWNVIALDIHQRMGHPSAVLDVAGGEGYFIRAVPAADRWMVERMTPRDPLDSHITFLNGDVLDVRLPEAHFDGIFVSNVLEHLPDQESVADLLSRLRSACKPEGRIAVMGPNFAYCSKQYFDCADHVLALTHTSVEEHLYAAGFEPISVSRRYLPYSFRGVLPPSPSLTRVYLKLGLLQRLLGKQFLVTARKTEHSD